MEAPYCILPDIEALPDARGEERLRICRRIAAAVGDPLVLREILGIDPAEFDGFYPDMIKPNLTTADTIDSFLDKYGDPSAKESEEVKTIEELVPLAPPDYNLDDIAADLDDEALPDDDDPTASLLDSFLSTNPPRKASASRREPPVLSESLARAMIKNGNYRKALEIISDLSLNNPKKSIYFADQMRFLKKLILNQSKSEAAE